MNSATAHTCARLERLTREIGEDIADAQAEFDRLSILMDLTYQDKMKQESVDLESQEVITQENVIRLDVGGIPYTTTLDTLRKVPGSMLAIMFSEGHMNPGFRTDDGRIFIDRDGELFASVLEYLRTGVLDMKGMGWLKMRRLSREFNFFGLGWRAPYKRRFILMKRPEKSVRLLAILRYERAFLPRNQQRIIHRTHDTYRTIQEP